MYVTVSPHQGVKLVAELEHIRYVVQWLYHGHMGKDKRDRIVGCHQVDIELPVIHYRGAPSVRSLIFSSVISFKIS